MFKGNFKFKIINSINSQNKSIALLWIIPDHKYYIQGNEKSDKASIEIVDTNSEKI